jgi:CHAT domain-containing protein
MRGGEPVRIGSLRADPWRALYGFLIAPVRPWLPAKPGASITIVPHGALIGLSFAALQSPASRYLLEDYTISYAPAGGVLQYTATRRRADARTAGVLVVADPLVPPPVGMERPLPRLPGARSEARAITQVLSPSQVTLLADTAATEAAVRAGTSNRAVIHFATHAIVEEEQPNESFLALGRASSDRAGDGPLTAEDIYSLSLDSDLVMLSACRSASGTLPGDGVATFARAFLTAGSATVIASLWDVADEPTNRLVPEFYRAWKAGASKARALRTAQLRLLADLRAGRIRVDTIAGPIVIPEQPIFWAGFALFGEPD